MDFLNKSLTQLSDLFRSMTPGARITAGLLAAVLVVSLVWLVGQNASGPDDYLLGGQSFSAGEINEMEMAFGRAGLDGYTIEGNKIRVPRGNRAAFMGAIADAGALPTDFGASLRKSLEDGGPFITAREREERLKAATQEELGLWIRKMPGIEKAAVAYEVKTTGGLSKVTLATASVSIKLVGSKPLEDERVRAIRHMVASAISGMKPENVVITDLNGGVAYSGAGASGAADDTLLALSRSYEAKFRNDVETQLAFIPGARVSVAVTLDPEQERIGREISFSKEKSATLETAEDQSDESRQSTGPGGVPGTRSNTAASNTPAQIETKSGSATTVAKNSTKTVMAPGGLEHEFKQLGLQPKRVTIAVSIPRSYFEKLWRKRNSAAEDQKVDGAQLAALEVDEVQKIRKLVANLLPVSDSVKDPVKPVAVEIFDDFQGEEIAETSTATTILAWLGNYWSTLGMGGLGLVALLMLRSTVRATAAPEPAPIAAAAAPSPLPGIEGEKPTETTVEPAAKKPRTLKRREPGMSLRDELADLIREDPDGAAAILRSWIGSAV